MVQGSYDRREVTTRRVEYVIETPYGEPVEGKTLGVVLAQVHRELGDRALSDDAYRVRGEEGRVVIEFDVEQMGHILRAGDELVVQVGGGGPLGQRMGRVVADMDGELKIFVSNE